MADQGRFFKVMLALMVAMTVGALILFGLEGKPIKPMAFSLSATQTQLCLQTNDSSVVGTQTPIQPGRWKNVEISCLPANGQVRWNSGPTDRLAAEYHFVISNGKGAEDGKIFATSRWEKQVPCIDARGNLETQGKIKVCLITDSKNTQCSALQMKQLDSLVIHLVRSFKAEMSVTWKELSI